VTLIALGPAGNDHDPFAGGHAGPAPEFDGTRFASAGASEEELSYIAYGFDTMTRGQQNRAARWIESASDEEFASAFAQWREAHERELEQEQLIDGTVEEVLERVHGDGSVDYARRVLAAEHATKGDEARKTLVEPLEKLVADHEEAEREKAAHVERLEELTAGTVQDVINRVGDDSEHAARALAAEHELKGEEARTTLVAALEKIAAPATEKPSPAAEKPHAGAQGAAHGHANAPAGASTPPNPDQGASDQESPGAEGSDGTS
jgi:hypothetical protein